MVDSEGFAPATILAELEAEAANYADTAGGGFVPLPSVLPITDIRPIPTLFQCRPLSEPHVAELAKAIREGDVMPPLLVIRVAGRAVLLDGHHRLEALRLAGKAEVAVEGFEGSLREAVLRACAANAKTKLPMTKTERTDTAWKFVLLGVGSKAGVMAATGVGDGTVARMRKAKAALGEEAFGVPSWARAMLLHRNANPADMTDDDLASWKETTAQRHADTMVKTFGGSLSANPEVAARALAIYFGRRLGPVALELRDYLPSAEDGDY